MPDVRGREIGCLAEAHRTMLRLVDPWPEMSFDDLIDGLKGIEGLTLVGGWANFQFKGRPFLHFHEAPDGPYADVRLGSAWEEFGAATSADRQTLFALVTEHVATQARPKGLERRSSRRRRGDPRLRPQARDRR